MSQVSNKTFNISPDDVDLTVPHMQLGLSAAGQYNGNPSPFLTPDSNGPVSNQYSRGTVGSPDVDILRGCLSEGSPVDNSYGNNSTQDSFSHSMSLNLNQTFIASPMNTSVHFWNANLLPVSRLGVISEEYQVPGENPEEGATSGATSPDSTGRDSRLGWSETSHRGFTENDCCSMSSGEMVVRKNSFCLEDQSLSLVSSLEDASVPLVGGNVTFPAESNLLSTAFLDIHEKSLERVTGEESAGLPCLGMTFIQSVPPAEEQPSNPSVALPGENEAGLMVTFVCKTSPPDQGKDGPVPTEVQQLSETATPEHGKSLVSALSAVRDSIIQTSTPLQTLGNKASSVPTFSESPTSSPIVESPGRQAKKQKTSLTGKNLVVGLIPLGGKAKKLEVKKFPKSDFSGIKSKVVTRHSANQASASGSQSQHPNQSPSQVCVKNKQPEAHPGPLIKISTTKLRSAITASSVNTTTVGDTQRDGHSEDADAAKARPPAEARAEGVESGEPSQNPSTDETTSPAPSRNVASEAAHDPSNQVPVAAKERAGNQTFCLSSPEKSPGRSGQRDPKVRPKKCASNKIEVKAGSVLGQDKPTILKTRLRCSSESSSPSYRSFKEKISSLKVSNSFTVPEGNTSRNQSKLGNLHRSPLNKKTTQAKAVSGPIEVTTRSAKKISLVAQSSNLSTAGASGDEKKKRLWQRPSPRRSVGTLQASASRLGTSTQPTRPRQVTLARDECNTSSAADSAQSKQKSNTDGTKVPAAGEQSLASSSLRPHLNALRRPRTPSHTSLGGLPATSASKLSRKSLGRIGIHTEPHKGAGSSQVSGETTLKPTPLKAAGLKTRLFATPAKNIGQALSTTSKPATFLTKGSSGSAASSPAKRASLARFVGLASCGRVDKKTTPKAGSQQQGGSRPSQGHGPPDVVPACTYQDGRTEQNSGNCTFETPAIVLGQISRERDDAGRQSGSPSQEQVSLQGEQAGTVHSSSERLEKEELRAALEDALQRAQEQHQKEVAELERRLQAFDQAENKVQQAYQEEADRCRSLQQQLEELKSSHEAMKQELESRHTEQLQRVREQCDLSLEELTKVHREELQSLGDSLKGQIEELAAENRALLEKFTAEENRRKELAEHSQKDSHTLYLEQELESLKVVLDIKNKQLHQQEKMTLELDKLRDKNVKLDESRIKVQQENEDLKARMVHHATLSRQLSTEQAVLQESLQKESKVNKRLSMENEELLWKLNNGDVVGSPRKVLSASPSHSFSSLQSPRSSDLFSSPPVSPR